MLEDVDYINIMYYTSVIIHQIDKSLTMFTMWIRTKLYSVREVWLKPSYKTTASYWAQMLFANSFLEQRNLNMFFCDTCSIAF